MSKEDPFGLGDQRTVVLRPNPGGAAPDVRPGPDTPPATSHELAVHLASPLLQVAEPLLLIATQLRSPQPPQDIEGLHAKVLGDIRTLPQRLEGTRLPHGDIERAGYALAALIDDVVLNTPWGHRSQWPTKRLAAVLYRDVDAGKGFFKQLDDVMHQSDRHGDLLELMYTCLAMGFEGTFRVNPTRGRSLAHIKDDAYEALRRSRPKIERAFSPNWQGHPVPLPRLDHGIPAWTAGVVAVALLALVYAGFAYRLGLYGDAVAGDLPSSQPVQLDRGTVAQATLPAPELPIYIPETGPDPRLFLAAEQAAGEVVLHERGQGDVVTIRGQGLFASGSDQIQPANLDLIRRVGIALNERPGSVSVLGHSDNIPINTTRFPSNWELSRARAASVARLLAAQMHDPDRLRVEGLADTQPVATNATPEGRAMNRRIEIVVARS